MCNSFLVCPPLEVSFRKFHHGVRIHALICHTGRCSCRCECLVLCVQFLKHFSVKPQHDRSDSKPVVELLPVSDIDRRICSTHRHTFILCIVYSCRICDIAFCVCLCQCPVVSEKHLVECYHLAKIAHCDLLASDSPRSNLLQLKGCHTLAVYCRRMCQAAFFCFNASPNGFQCFVYDDDLCCV